jgi:cobalt-zinc-cadmium efflux system membrane fusion protein
MSAQSHDTGPVAGPGRRWIMGILGSIPTLLVLALIAAVGYAGHRTGWTLPSYSSLTGPPPEADDWCEEHRVPATVCVECKPELMPRPAEAGYCKTHGVAECTLCHPELAQLPRPRAVTPEDLDRARRALDFTTRPVNSATCKLHLRRIQFPDVAAVERAGIEVEPVWTGPVAESVSAPGELAYDRTRVARVSARAQGPVVALYKRLGEAVKAGEIVALIESQEVGRAKAEWLRAFATAELRRQALATLRASGGVVPATRDRELDAAAREAEIVLGTARQALANLGLPLPGDMRAVPPERLEASLRFLGLPDAIVKSLDPARATSNLMPVLAPADGVVTTQDVVLGETADPARPLFELTDTTALCVFLELKGEEADRVRVGRVVKFKLDTGGPEVVATVAWKAGQADPRTRTVKVRADVTDRTKSYTAGTFGVGSVLLREEPNATVVPNTAVHDEGCCQIVFVRDKSFLSAESPKVFYVRVVRTGAKDEKQTEIIAGVLPGEIVATVNSGSLRAELLRGNFGAG